MSNIKLSQKIIVFFFGYDVPRDSRSVMYSGDEASIRTMVNQLIDQHRYIPVAAVEYDEQKSVDDNLEHAWKALQNGVMTESWCLSPLAGVRPLVEPLIVNGKQMGHRSADIGDFLVIGGDRYMVSTIGFRKIG